MVIDSSPVVAIFESENGHEEFLNAIEAAPDCYMSVVCLYEAAVRLYCKARNAEVVAKLFEFVDAMSIQIVDFDQHSAVHSVKAYARWGKGIHPAKLNLVDSIVYALAQDMGEPVLFKGDDFSKTDILSAL